MKSAVAMWEVLAGKSRVFLRDPWGSLGRRAEYHLFRARAKRFWAGQPLLGDFLAARPADAFAPDWADLWFLYRAVRERRPQTVLEFGSGCSTLALALALRDNHVSTQSSGRLLSIDSVEFWAETNRKAMPAELRGFHQILHRPVRCCTHQGTPCFRHLNLPDVRPDLVYLDGPELTPECRVAVDVLDLEERFPPGLLLIVDGRWENAMFLKRNLRGRYRFEYRTLYQNSTFELLPAGEGA